MFLGAVAWTYNFPGGLLLKSTPYGDFYSEGAPAPASVVAPVAPVAAEEKNDRTAAMEVSTVGQLAVKGE